MAMADRLKTIHDLPRSGGPPDTRGADRDASCNRADRVRALWPAIN